MVAIKFLLATAVAAVSVLAQADPTGDPTEAQQYWETATSPSTEVVGGDGTETRSISNVERALMKDPYLNFYCHAPYTKPAGATKCSRNNCFRGFLNARDGSEGKHCPKEAYGFCCIWNYASIWQKWWAIKWGFAFAFAPYAENCKGSGDNTWDVLAKIDDTCGCTLNHEVTIDVTSDYYHLRAFPPFAPQCH